MKSIMKQQDNISILFLRSVHDAYGVSKIMLQLANKLKNKGYKIVFASDNNDEFKKDIVSCGFRHYTVPLRAGGKNIINFIKSFTAIVQIIKKEEINIIHSHHRWSSFISFFVSKLLKIPLLTTYHAISQGNRFTLWGDKIISVSEDAKKHLIEYYKVIPDHIVVIHNGIEMPDMQDIAQASKKQTYVTSITRPVFANIARMSPEKDQETLLHAFAKVLMKYPDVKLLLVGNGPLENELKTLAEKLNILDNTDFLGEVKDINPILSCCDCVVLSSLTEGLPLAVLEAFSFGKPVISTSVGDIPAVVINGVNGLLVSPGNRKQLVEAFGFMVSNRPQAIVMGEKGREIVSKKFSVRIMTEQTEKIYLELLSIYNKI